MCQFGQSQGCPCRASFPDSSNLSLCLVGRHPPPVVAVPPKATPSAAYWIWRWQETRGEEKPPAHKTPPPCPPCSAWSLLLTSSHAMTPNGLRWLINDTTLPLSFFKHMKSQSTPPLCPFKMHDKTAWLQPHSKTSIQIFFSHLPRSRLDKRQHKWIFKEATNKDYRSEHGNVKMPLRDCFPSLKMKLMLDIILNLCALSCPHNSFDV